MQYLTTSDWNEIETILLDMDGTLLDLNFDNHFWLEHMPKSYAAKQGISRERAAADLVPRFKRMEGTLAWYCIDHWSNELGMDVALLKEEVAHLIAVHPHVVEFLDALRARGKRVVLVTNAHAKSLELKMRKTSLANHLDKTLCSHDFGLPKEDVAFWDKLKQQEPFDPGKTLFVDDSIPVLRSAERYGIRHVLAVTAPDTQKPDKDAEGFPFIRDFSELLPGLLALPEAK